MEFHPNNHIKQTRIIFSISIFYKWDKMIVQLYLGCIKALIFQESHPIMLMRRMHRSNTIVVLSDVIVSNQIGIYKLLRSDCRGFYFIFYFRIWLFVSNLQMRQQNSEKPRGSAFSLSSILEFVVFILAVIILQIPMLYVAGSEAQYPQQQHPLDSIFDTPKYQKLKDTISSPKQKYINLQGDKQSGVMSFIHNYAVEMKDKKQIVLREYSDDDEFESIYAVFRLAKSMIENKIDLEQDHPKVFILFCFSGQIPKSEIHQIAVNPQDRIIAVTSGSQKIKGFKNVQFPPVKISQLKKQLISKMNIDEPIVDILLEHYESVPNIFQHLNHQEFSIPQHLGNQYSEISSLDQASQQILEGLCKNGQANGDQDSLTGVGVIMQNGRYYWKSDNTKLNYELQEKVLCEGGVASDDILAEYEDIEDDSEEQKKLDEPQDSTKEEQNNQNEEEDKQEEEEQKEKSKKKANKKSKKSKSKQANNGDQGDNTAEDDDEQDKKSKKSKKGKKDKSDDHDNDDQNEKRGKKNKKSKKQPQSEQLQANSEASQQKSEQANEGNDNHKDDKKEKKKDKKKKEGKDKEEKEDKDKEEEKENKKEKKKKKEKEDDDNKKKQKKQKKQEKGKKKKADKEKDE